MVEWVRHVRPEHKDSLGELGTRMKQEWQCLFWHRRLEWFGHLEKWDRMIDLENVEPLRLMVIFN